MKKIVCLALLVFMLVGCTSNSVSKEGTYKIGICNYVEDASLNQIVSNIEIKLWQ